MALGQILDHAARALARLPAQFRVAVRIRGLLTAISNEVQELENGLWGARAVRDIDLAETATLDNLGKLIDAPVRGLKTDTQYRGRIRAQILANKSNGQNEIIYGVAKQIVSTWNVTGQPQVLDDTYSGAYTVKGYIAPLEDPAETVLCSEAEARELALLLDDVSAAGVRGIVISQPQSAELSFCFAGGVGAGFETGEFVGAYDGGRKG
jgi:hypothetical protein